MIWRAIAPYMKCSLIKAKLQLQNNDPNIQTKQGLSCLQQEHITSSSDAAVGVSRQEVITVSTMRTR